MTDLRQAAQRLVDRIDRDGASPLDWSEYNALIAALEQQAEPTCPDCKAAVLYECVACSSNNYPPQQQAEPVMRYDGLHEYASQHRLNYNELCSVVRASITTPPQRKPLTDERILHLVETHVGGPSPSYPLDNSDWIDFTRAIEQAHNIKEQP